MKSAMRVALPGMLLAGFLLALLINQAAGIEHLSGTPYVRGFERPGDGVEVMLGVGDGQAFAALATDPALNRPERFRAGADEAAYRAQRPLLGYAAWLFSLGRQEWVPEALVALSILGGGVATGASAALLAERGALPQLGMIVVVLPGSVAALQWLGPELLGLGLSALGVLWWERGRLALAITALSLAGLARETLLLVPIVLAIQAFAHERRRALLTIVPMGVWLGWTFVVRWRFGAWFFEAGEGRVATPFDGLAHGLERFDRPSVVIGLFGLAILLALLLLRPSDRLVPIAFGYAILALIMGSEVWRRWQDFSRPLLPLYTFGVIALLGHHVKRSGQRRASGPGP